MGAHSELFEETGLTEQHLRVLADSHLRVAPIADQLLDAKRKEELVDE
jgi:hypothetical protein